jgi:uroporphyrinogen decarboxylase
MMSSRERVRRLLNREPVDRIPNGLGGCETAGLHILAYDTLKDVLGIQDPRNRMYTFMSNAVVEPCVLDAMNGDVIVLQSRMCPARLWGEGSDSEWKEEIFWGKRFHVPKDWHFRTEADGTIWWGEWTKCPPGGIYFDGIPRSKGIDLSAPLPKPMPDEFNPSHDIPDEYLRALENSAKWLYENTEYSICCGEMIHDLQLKPGGLMSWWVRMVQEPEVAHEFLHKACEAGISHVKLLHQAVGKYADMMMLADDIGDVSGVTIGPDLWREIYKPHYKRLFSEWHKLTNMKVSLHSCGSISDILGDLIECGLDVINPLQISSQRMEPEYLKQNFGDQIIFYGGVFDAVQTPPSTPPEVVYETVKQNIMAFSKGGGYLFAGVHNIPGDTPKEHIKAILAAYENCAKNPDCL